MGVNNRQRRARKARTSRKQRATQQGSRPPRTEPFDESDRFQVGVASLALRHLAVRRADGYPPWLEDDDGFTCHPEGCQQLAFDDQLAVTVRDRFARGWTPLDLYEAARRNVDPSAVEHLMCVVAQQTAGRGAVHPQWTAQVTALCTTIDGGSRAWSARMGLPWPEAGKQLLVLLAHLLTLPTVETSLPAPGTPAAGVSASSSRVDERVLRKVRALLAKAESTEYEGEADALTAKAQQLMTTHSIDRALAEAAAPRAREHPLVRRIWLDAPYLTAKSMLIHAVARSNDCCSILIKPWGFVTLVGHTADLDSTELLSTSLLVQATRAMTAAGPQTTRYGTSRTRSFRQSFLVAYAGRIGERLTAASTTAQAQADAAHGGTLLPVLAARAEQVRAAADAMFPNSRRSTLSAGDRDGWGAGRAAADLARFDVRGALGARAG